MENEKLKQYIKTALYMVYANDKYLIDHADEASGKGIKDNDHTCERSVVFRFAHYLQCILDKDGELRRYNLDCEYNRNMDQIKCAIPGSNGTFPDVILHKRGSNKYNILVMEFKGYWNRNRSDLKYDIEKIKGFTDPNGEYEYKLGLAVWLGKTIEKTKITEIVNGEKREYKVNEL